MPILQKEQHFANSSASAHQGNKTFRRMREDFARKSGIEASDHENPKKKELRLEWGQWDHKPNTTP